MNSKIIGFSGQIASGKTTISRAVASKLGWRWFGFGELLRFEAVNFGLNPEDREVLKRLGKQAIDNGWEQFCSRVLDAAGWKPGADLILDGVRHIEAIHAIQRLAGLSDIRLIFVSTEASVRKARLLVRDRREEIDKLDADALETQVLSLLYSRADFTVDGSLPLDNCVTRILRWLSELESGQTENETLSFQRSEH